MNRRIAIIALLAMPLGYFRAFAAQAGWLAVDLGQWRGIKVTLGGNTITVSATELFNALKGQS